MLNNSKKQQGIEIGNYFLTLPKEKINNIHESSNLDTENYDMNQNGLGENKKKTERKKLCRL